MKRVKWRFLQVEFPMPASVTTFRFVCYCLVSSVSTWSKYALRWRLKPSLLIQHGCSLWCANCISCSSSLFIQFHTAIYWKISHEYLGKFIKRINAGLNSVLLKRVFHPKLASKLDSRLKNAYGRFVTSEVFPAVTMNNSVFWDVTPRGSCMNRRFGVTYAYAIASYC
jgi:hypothetical protein